MGISKCDDGEKDIQRDLKSMKKESNCKKKVWQDLKTFSKNL